MMMKVIDKSSPIPRVSWAFFLAFVALVVAGTTFRNRMEDVADRQTKYIERRDQQHAAQQVEIDALRAELRAHEEEYHDVCSELAVRWQELICD